MIRYNIFLGDKACILYATTIFNLCYVHLCLNIFCVNSNNYNLIHLKDINL